jgi:hypothetical protein
MSVIGKWSEVLTECRYEYSHGRAPHCESVPSCGYVELFADTIRSRLPRVEIE